MSWLLVVIPESIAHEISRAEVQRKGGTFHLFFAASIRAHPAEVYRILTDYPLMPGLSETVQESRVINVSDNGKITRAMRLSLCIMFFCKNMRIMEQIQENGRDHIQGVVIPAQSDFRSGSSQWRVSAGAGGVTRVELASRFQPDFWIPPVIGTWIIRNRLQEEFNTLSRNIEKMAGK